MSVKSELLHTTYFDFINDFDGKIGLDDTFNVGSLERGRWDDNKNAIPFIEGIINGTALSDIFLVDLNKCLENCFHGSADYEYFASWVDKGYDWLAVDGNNRTITTRKFFLLESIGLKTKQYIVDIDDRNVAFNINKDNNTWSKLPQGLRDHIAQMPLIVKVITKATRVEVTDAFRGLNSGMHFNAQEWRNSIISKVATAVREMGYKYDDSAGSFMNISDYRIIRKDFHEFVISSLVYYSNQEDPKTINGTAQDKAYEDNSIEEINLVGFQKQFTAAMDLLVANDFMSYKNFTKTNGMNFWMFWNYLNDKKYKINKKDELLKWFIDTEIERCADETMILHKTKNSYSYGGLNTDGAAELKVRLGRIIEDFVASDLFDLGVITSVDEKRTYNDKQRFELWKKQGGVCALTGEPIPSWEILDGTKWEGDHILEWSKGGKTTVENGQLVSVEAHKQKTREFMMAS